MQLYVILVPHTCIHTPFLPCLFYTSILTPDSHFRMMSTYELHTLVRMTYSVCLDIHACQRHNNVFDPLGSVDTAVHDGKNESRLLERGKASV